MDFLLTLENTQVDRMRNVPPSQFANCFVKAGFALSLANNRDINLLIGFPASLNLGVLKFEIKQTIKRISDYFENLKNNKNLTSNEILFEN
ncbi:MAG: hypothetical protein P8Y70_18995 [Candidatus Lokiarchaeota archaeon]